METQNFINLNTVYFHSLGSYSTNDRLRNSLIKLESILQNGSILSRQEQINNNSNNQALSSFLDMYLSPNWAFNWNGMNHISICQKTSFKNPEYNSEAFLEYVRGNVGIGIILSKDIKHLIDNSRPKLMDGEYQIKDKIPLSHMVGIFFGGKSHNELSKEIQEAHQLGMSTKQIEECLPYLLTPFHLEVYTKLQELLSKYGYNVPIYSSRDGFEVSDLKNLIDSPELSN